MIIALTSEFIDFRLNIIAQFANLKPAYLNFRNN